MRRRATVRHHEEGAQHDGVVSLGQVEPEEPDQVAGDAGEYVAVLRPSVDDGQTRPTLAALGEHDNRQTQE
jgi:hypothetical protein